MNRVYIGDTLTFTVDATDEVTTGVVIEMVDKGAIEVPIVEHAEYGIIELTWKSKKWIAKDSDTFSHLLK
jgi:hypothetical protein